MTTETAHAAETETAPDLHPQTAEYLSLHPHAELLNSTARGIHLIFDPAMVRDEGVVGATGTMYPVFGDAGRGDVIGYESHTVDMETQRREPPVLDDEV